MMKLVVACLLFVVFVSMIFAGWKSMDKTDKITGISMSAIFGICSYFFIP